MRKRCFNIRGQAVVEYAVLIGIVTAALIGMQIYAKRSIQAGLKTAADSLSPFGAADPDGRKAQFEGMRYETGQRRNPAVAAGTALDRHSMAKTTTNRTVRDGETDGGGRQRTTITDTTKTEGELGDGVSSRSEVVVEIR